MLRKLVASGCYNIPWTCTHVWCYANWWLRDVWKLLQAAIPEQLLSKTPKTSELNKTLWRYARCWQWRWEIQKVGAPLLEATGKRKAPSWNGSIVEMSWLWSSKRRKKTEIEDSELTSQQRSRPYCMVIITDFGVTIGNRLEIVLFFWNNTIKIVQMSNCNLAATDVGPGRFPTRRDDCHIMIYDASSSWESKGTPPMQPP